MQPISAEIVEKTWQKLARMKPAQAIKTVEEAGKKQPGVLAYLMGVGGDDFDEEEREIMLYIGLVVWEIMIQGNPSMREISLEDLEAAEDANFDMLEKLGEESTGDFISMIDTMLSRYNQPEVLKYVVEALMENEEGEMVTEIDDDDEDNRGFMLIYLKTVVDCLDAA